MKKLSLLLASLLFWLYSGHALALEQQVRHVVLVWLNQSGNQSVQSQFINNSKSLKGLPGVVSRHVGVAMPSNSKIADASFDVAITVVLEDRAALDSYLNHPQHKQVVKLNKPLVAKIVAYNIVSPE